MSPVELTASGPSGGVANSYTCAYRRELGSGGLTTMNDRSNGQRGAGVLSAGRQDTHHPATGKSSKGSMVGICTKLGADKTAGDRAGSVSQLRRANGQSAGRLHTKRIFVTPPGNSASPWACRDSGQSRTGAKCSTDIDPSGICLGRGSRGIRADIL
jgi:hypothetical protein